VSYYFSTTVVLQYHESDVFLIFCLNFEMSSLSSMRDQIALATVRLGIMRFDTSSRTRRRVKEGERSKHKKDPIIAAAWLLY
jgi:hypothetical protein